MLFWLQEILRDYYTPINVLRYLPFRIIASVFTSLVATWLLYPWFIRMLQIKQIGQVVRTDGPERHLSKSGTPTMGGTLMIVTVLVSVLLWGDLKSPYIWLTLIIMLAYAILGFMDDYFKITRKKGVRGKTKLFWQFLVSLSLMFIFFYFFADEVNFNTRLYFPFMRIDHWYLELPPWLYAVFASVVIVGTSNAVNLTDGLDGLAIMPSISSAAVFMLFAYLSGAVIAKFDVQAYLLIPRIENSGELGVIAGSFIGAGIGFLWYNSFPASVFMGDVGALSIGGVLGCLAVFTKNEFLSIIINGVFVVEALSVIAQTTSFKLTGRRVFRMAPLHHHYELQGLSEPKIIVRFWIVSILLGLIALASIKVR